MIKNKEQMQLKNAPNWLVFFCALMILIKEGRYKTIK